MQDNASRKFDAGLLPVAASPVRDLASLDLMELKHHTFWNLLQLSSHRVVQQQGGFNGRLSVAFFP
jgi:hypothetical protein